MQFAVPAGGSKDGPARRPPFLIAAACVGCRSVGGRPIVSATSEIPEDFPLRIATLKEMTGLSWNQFCEVVGVTPKRMRKWRSGTEPNGGGLMGIVILAAQVSGGLDVVMGEGFTTSLLEG